MIVSDDATAHLSALLLELVSLGEHLLILLLVTNYLLLGHYNHIITTIVDWCAGAIMCTFNNTYLVHPWTNREPFEWLSNYWLERYLSYELIVGHWPWTCLGGDHERSLIFKPTYIMKHTRLDLTFFWTASPRWEGIGCWRIKSKVETDSTSGVIYAIMSKLQQEHGSSIKNIDPAWRTWSLWYHFSINLFQGRWHLHKLWQGHLSLPQPVTFQNITFSRTEEENLYLQFHLLVFTFSLDVSFPAIALLFA